MDTKELEKRIAAFMRWWIDRDIVPGSVSVDTVEDGAIGRLVRYRLRYYKGLPKFRKHEYRLGICIDPEDTKEGTALVCGTDELYFPRMPWDAPESLPEYPERLEDVKRYCWKSDDWEPTVELNGVPVKLGLFKHQIRKTMVLEHFVYTVRDDRTGAVRDFQEPREALDWAEKVNGKRLWWGKKVKGRRMARIIKFTDPNDPNMCTDLGEMKYEILPDTGIDASRVMNNCKFGHTVYRIRALRDFETVHGPVRAGDKGGWVEHYENLAHEGNCWMFDDSCAYGRARVYEDAVVYGKSNICDSGLNFKTSAGLIGDAGKVYGQAIVCDRSVVYGTVHDQATISSGCVYDGSVVSGKAIVERASVRRCSGKYEIRGHAHVYGPCVDCAIERHLLYLEDIFAEGGCLTACRGSYDRNTYIVFEGKIFENVEAFVAYINNVYFFSPHREKLLNIAAYLKGEVQWDDSLFTGIKRII